MLYGWCPITTAISRYLTRRNTCHSSPSFAVGTNLGSGVAISKFTDRWTNKARGVQTECSRSAVMYVLNTRKAAASRELYNASQPPSLSQTFETVVIFMKPAPVFCAGHHFS